MARERRGNVIALRGKIEAPITKSPHYNFLPIVICPRCNRKNRAAVSGWGGITSTRFKTCKYCKKDFKFKITTEAIRK